MAAEQYAEHQNTALERVAERLLETAPRLARLITAEAQGGSTSGALTMTQLRALGMLARGSRLPSQLARDLEITPATASEVVELLVRRGLVERGDRPEDRRHTPLSLTPAGLALYRTARQNALDALELLLAQIEPTCLLDLERGLGALQSALRERVAAARETTNAG